MKLLARLRDLKLSLMSTLSFTNVLKADHMLDALGYRIKVCFLGLRKAIIVGGPWKTMNLCEVNWQSSGTIEFQRLLPPRRDTQPRSIATRVKIAGVEEHISQLQGAASGGVSLDSNSSVITLREPEEPEVTVCPDNKPPEDTRAMEFLTLTPKGSVQSFHSALSHQSKNTQFIIELKTQNQFRCGYSATTPEEISMGNPQVLQIPCLEDVSNSESNVEEELA